MTDKRVELQGQLESYFDDDSRVTEPSKHVSYQPDENSVLAYPHIVYSRDPAYKLHADNLRYLATSRYKVTYIDRKPDQPAFFELDKRPLCSHEASFIRDGLNHYIFDLYH